MSNRNYIFAKIKRLGTLALVSSLSVACMACAGGSDSSTFNFGDIVKLREYDYKTEEKASLNLFNMQNYKFNVSDEKFYAKRTFKFGPDSVELSKIAKEDNQTEAFVSSGNEVMLSSF